MYISHSDREESHDALSVPCRRCVNQLLHEMSNTLDGKIPFHVIYTMSARMVADIHTKGFASANAWEHAHNLANIIDLESLNARISDHAQAFEVMAA